MYSFVIVRRRGAAAAPVVELSKISQREHCGVHTYDLRAESGADALFADEDCTQPCTTADLVHGAIVYARHNAAEDDEEGGDAMADEEEG